MHNLWFLFLVMPSGKVMYFVNYKQTFALTESAGDATPFESMEAALRYRKNMLDQTAPGAGRDFISRLDACERVVYELH